MYLSVIDVKPLSDHRILLQFENHEKRIMDMTPFLTLGAYQELVDNSLFNGVKLCFDTIEWPNGVDFDPELLYSLSISQ